MVKGTSKDEKIENILKKVKKCQCIGGCFSYAGERRGAMKIGHLLKSNDISFSDALKKSWELIKIQRLEPCIFQQENPNEK